MSEYYIGIDLGTTNSLVAVYHNGEAKVVVNEQGNRLTPSCVAYSDEGQLVGEGAWNEAVENPQNTIYASKRLMGRSMNDPNIKDDIRKWRFSVIEDDDKAKIKVRYQGNEKKMFPEQIAAAILEKMKNIVEMTYGIIVKDVVISVPAYFNDAQLQATKDAAAIAGLKVQHLIHEPTAAAIAYGFEKNLSGKTILVYDLGGGTFDVSVLEINGHEYVVKAVKGDTHLGGEDFDENMVQYFVKHLLDEGRDISKDPMLMTQLKKECESGKRLLSTQTQVKLKLIGTGLKLEPISRTKFEIMNEKLFKRTIDLVVEVLEDANMQKSDIDEILLVGGSSRIPEIEKLLSDFFEKKTLNKSENPDEVVALGAAIRAAEKITLLDVCPLSLSNCVSDGTCTVVIPRNTPIPTTLSKTFVTASDNQKAVEFKIYEGERKFAKDNHFLGSFIITGIPPRPCGETELTLTFEIDINGILTVTGTEPTTGKTETLVISNKSRLSKKEATRLVREAEKFREEDKIRKERLASIHNFEASVNQKKTDVKRMLNLDAERKEIITNELEKYEKWLELKKNARKDEIDEKVKELENRYCRMCNEKDKCIIS